MRRLLLTFIILACIQMYGSSQAVYRIPERVERIVFLGNSITYSGQYVSYIEAYLTLTYPGKHFEFINLGLPSETVSGLSEPNHAKGQFPRPDLHERLERIIQQINPDLVFACYGMNDGIYLPFDDARFAAFKEGIAWLHDQLSKSGALVIHITPPIFDERKGHAYANVLDIYSDWLISCRYTENWEVVDIHWPMKKYLEDRRIADSTFAFARDGVHPDKNGHWMMAKQILIFLGEQKVKDAIDIESAISSNLNSEKVLQLVEFRQEIMKNAWLSSVGHSRPNMKPGLPFDEAREKLIL